MNNMCKNCLCLNNSCQGTQEAVWTGCIYKKTATNEATEYMTKEEVNNIIDKLNGR